MASQSRVKSHGIMGCSRAAQEHKHVLRLSVPVCAGPRRLDRVSRFRQMQTIWAGDAFLQSGAAGANGAGGLPGILPTAQCCNVRILIAHMSATARSLQRASARACSSEMQALLHALATGLGALGTSVAFPWLLDERCGITTSLCRHTSCPCRHAQV